MTNSKELEGVITPEDMTKILTQVGDNQSNTTMQQIEGYLDNNYSFRYNEVTGRVEWQSKVNPESFQQINDYHINSLVRNLNRKRIKCSNHQVKNLLLSDYTPIFNPFKSYLYNLPVWDKTIDYIKQLAETVTTTDDVLWQTCFMKWFVALVGSLIQDDVINHTVIVFSGAQGVGKTSWMLNLVPKELKEYCYSGTINPNNKDTLMQLSECMLINLDELENLNRSELGTMKEVITKANIRVRRPYGYTSESLPRRASFAGSVNGKEFLSDTTGNRRFLCFAVPIINYKHTISLEKAFAQALHLFNNGFKYWFDSAEIAAITANNEQYRIMSVEEELLLGHFQLCKIEEADHFFTTTELLDYFTDIVKINITDTAKQKMGKALAAHKFLRLKKKGRYVYALKEINKKYVKSNPNIDKIIDDILVVGVTG